MDRTEELNVALYKKLENELAEYKKELMLLTPEEILSQAYDYTVREDIVFCLEYSDLTCEQAEALLKEEKPLELLYRNWLDTDISYMDKIYDSIETTADGLKAAAPRPDRQESER